ncbi:3-oxoacyl-[acyl-carrier-protein] reductase FabG [Luteitalea pratensis]|uniref:3-oxoacyl-[acyl-carrier-protein] reductase FabG n=1 Tax=Luteitalea pratensis TaxID=1855912 RepID=A0A143PKC4_LUTPR|nr:SDR family oxidoreductase [Luteitalea pratensis]AMY08703.1 3-oxoacyl-[acyl-carrier-protein] reductase FabG [Luteitalea pratensis]
MTDLRDRVVLITGASTGIGAAAAKAFARAGSKLALHYNASAAEAEAVATAARDLGAETVLTQGDLGQAATVPRIVAETMERFGRIDVLINNAGGMLGRRSIAEYAESHLQEVLALNVTQVVLFVHAVVPIMRRQGGGVIINVSSIAARTGGAGGAVLYAAAKGFISTATHGWARELAGDNIRVNAVSPGVVTTPFHDRYSTSAQLETMRATIPLGRLGTAEECAGTFLYLASEKLSGYVTGQVVEVNGGQYMP